MTPGSAGPTARVWIGGAWRDAACRGTFRAVNPRRGEPIGEAYPVSAWEDIEATLRCADACADEIAAMPRPRVAAFLERYAAEIEAGADAIAETAEAETALPARPRLLDVELPRTLDQLRQSAAAAVEEGWRLPTIDSRRRIRSMLAPIGPVLTLGPNNFPLAYNAVCGGDFAAAIASGNPVIAKAHPLQPNTSRLLCQALQRAMQRESMPAGTAQMLYDVAPEDGERMIRDRRLAAVAFTGSRAAGLRLKAAADAAGKPAFLEMSSVNPVVLLPAALEAGWADIAAQFADSALQAAGQFCTNPGLLLLPASPAARRFTEEAARRFAEATPGLLVSAGARDGLLASIAALRSAGAELLTGGEAAGGAGFAVRPTLLRVDGEAFLAGAEALQREAFGACSLLVVCRDLAQLREAVAALEGQLVGSIYAAEDSADAASYAAVEPALRRGVGRLVVNRMTTGVAVSPAMQHGGPFPASGHAHFTGVGVPACLRRFTRLQCYDGVADALLPPLLADANPLRAWRQVDGAWTRDPLPR